MVFEFFFMAALSVSGMATVQKNDMKASRYVRVVDGDDRRVGVERALMWSPYVVCSVPRGCP